MILADSLAYRMRLAEIERRSFHGKMFACWNQDLVYRGNLVGIDGNLVVEVCAALAAMEVIERVV